MTIRSNLARVSARWRTLTDPPDLPQFGPNPVGQLTITTSRGAITLKLSVPSEPAEHTIVLGAVPC